MTLQDLTEHAREAIDRQCARHLHYTDGEYGRIVHLIPVYMTGWVAVFGDGDSGSYEWVVQPDSGWADDSVIPPLEWSNSGYGCAATALRDGLLRALGTD